MKNNIYDLFNNYSGNIPDIEENCCNTDRIEKLVLKKINKKKNKSKYKKAFIISFIAAVLSIGSVSTVAYAGGFSYFKEILHHSKTDKNIPDFLPLIENDNEDKMEKNISEQTITFDGNEELTITAEGMYYDNNTLMLGLKIVSNTNKEIPSDACIIPYFTKDLNGIQTELKYQSGVGHEAAVIKTNEPDMYYATYYLTEQNLAGSKIHVSLHNINTYEQINECDNELNKYQQKWRDEANDDSMTTEEWKKYWKENNFDDKIQDIKKELINNYNPVIEGEWSTDIDVPISISKPLNIENNGFNTTIDQLSITLKDENTPEGSSLIPVVFLKDGTCIFDAGTNEENWIYKNTDCKKEKHESFGYRFGDIYCYSKPHSIDDIECITVYVMNYTENDLKADEYEIYKAE